MSWFISTPELPSVSLLSAKLLPKNLRIILGVVMVDSCVTRNTGFPFANSTTIGFTETPMRHAKKACSVSLENGGNNHEPKTRKSKMQRKEVD